MNRGMSRDLNAARKPLDDGSSSDSEDIDTLLASCHVAAQTFLNMDHVGEVNLEGKSVYGACIALPQIARSVAYHRAYSVLMVRVLGMHILNLILQLLLIMFIAEATKVIDPLGGQMHLCDFGKDLDSCPGTVECTGPGGTQFTKTRFYSYEQWTIQKFVKQALLDVMPNHTDLINKKVDPGEYGMENYLCRLVCIFLFFLSVQSEVLNVWNALEVIRKVPTSSGRWVEIVPPSEAAKNCKCYEFEGLMLVRYRVNGMPLAWKIFNGIVVIFPQCFLLYFVVWEGTLMLMETAGILNLVLGAMSMSFILAIDELVLSALSTTATKHILENLEGMIIPSGSDDEKHTLEDKLELAREQGYVYPIRDVVYLLFPRRLVLVVMLMVFFIVKYYVTHCDFWAGSFYVSKALYLPKSTAFNLLDFVSGHIPTESKAVWSMAPPS